MLDVKSKYEELIEKQAYSVSQFLMLFDQGQKMRVVQATEV